jgi:hypothetical protein
MMRVVQRKKLRNKKVSGLAIDSIKIKMTKL